MKVSRFNPRSVIQQAMRAAEQALDKADQGNQQVSAQQLPGALKQVANQFGDEQVDRGEVLKAFVQSLESQLSGSLQKGEFVAGEVEKALDLVNFSQVGLQLQQLVKAQAAPKTVEGAEAAAQLALTTADETVTSQLEVLAALKDVAQAHAKENPNGAVAKLLKELVKERGKLLKKVADNTLAQAEAAHQELSDPGTRETLQVALQAAIDVNKAVSPRGARLKQLRAQQADVGAPGSVEQAAQQPFFARFLENQQTQGEPPKITDQMNPGDLVTLKFPSDAEDSGGGEDGEDIAVTKKFPSDNEDGGVDDGGITTAKFPSDAEDGGDGIEGGPGDVMVTRKFPSDNEDGGADDVGDMVTLKFPSDAEDGGNDPISGGGIGDMVTMKFPSDNEDGGGRPELIPEIAPELRPELQPELIPEIAPEIRPELIPEIAPEVRPGPGTLTPIEREMYATEGAVMKSAFHGTVGMQKRLEEIDRILTQAAVSPSGITNLSREKRALEAFMGGAGTMKKAVKDLEHTLTAGNLTQEGYEAVQAELAMYGRLYDTLDVLRGVEMKLMNLQDKKPVHHAELDILSTYLNFGVEGLEKRQEKLANSLAANPNPDDKFLLELEQKALKHFMYGQEALRGRIDEIDDLMTRAMISPDGITALTAERQLCRALLSDLKIFEKRAMKIGDILSDTGPIPEIAPEVQPELIVEVAPEIRPEIRPELIPEIAPEIRPETGPDDLTVHQRRSLQVEQAVVKAAFYGEEKMLSRIDEIDDLLQRARLDEPTYKRMTLERDALKTFLGGIGACIDKMNELKSLQMRATMTPEASADLEAEIAVYAALYADYQMLEQRMGTLGRRRHHTPAEKAELAVLKGALSGVDAMEKRQQEIHNLLISARLAPHAYQALVLEAEGLKAYRAGGPAVSQMIDELDNNMLTFGGTPEEHKKAMDRRELLKNIYNDLQLFDARAEKIDDQLDPPDVRPELIPEVAPEVRPEMIVEVAPELRPELIPELAPDMMPDGEDD